MKSYAICRRDFELLESIAELKDQVELDSERLALMENPTKKKAAEMYLSGITLWIREHGMSDSRAMAVAERHNIG